jgi:hypothetical protein
MVQVLLYKQIDLGNKPNDSDGTEYAKVILQKIPVMI